MRMSVYCSKILQAYTDLKWLMAEVKKSVAPDLTWPIAQRTNMQKRQPWPPLAKNSGCDDTVPFMLHPIDILGLLHHTVPMWIDAVVETKMGSTPITFILHVHCDASRWWQCYLIIKYQPLKYMLAPVSAPSQFRHWDFFRPVLALGKFIPVLAPCWNGDPVLALGAPFKNWVPTPNTIPNPQWPYHGGATTGTNLPSAGTGTLQYPSAGTGTVSGWAPTYITTRIHCTKLEMHATVCKTHAVDISSWQRLPSAVICNMQEKRPTI